MFRFKHHDSMLTGTVSKVDSDGLWIDASRVAESMQHDLAWGPMVRELKNPVLFVPFSSLMFLMAAQE
ncbi:MAG: hypothetical protein ACXVZZ_02720 [Terriglobales bacterium]